MSANDESLLAMDAARMSAGSIAMTMGWSEARVLRRLAVLKAPPEPAAPPPPAPVVAPSPVIAIAASADNLRVGRREASPYDIAHPRPLPAPPRRSAGVPPVRGRVTRLKPVTPQVARYAGWFLDAGWRLDEVAHLFDVAPEALAGGAA